MRTLWISLCVTLIIAFVEAQSVTVEKRSRLPIWRSPPEERRRLPLFPKNNKKFVVTEKTMLKTEVTKPMITTKRPLMRKLFVQEKIDERTWSYPPRATSMKPRQLNVPLTPHPKRDYNRRYKVKADDIIAKPSTVKTVITSARTESSANNVQRNKGNLIQVLNKINEHTNKTSIKQANNVIQNNNSVKVKSAYNFFKKPAINTAGSIKENMAATQINKQADKVTERVFLNKQADNVMQNTKPLNASSLDTASEEYVNESDHESSKAILIQKTVNEQLNKTTEKVLLTKRVDNVMQNNKLLKTSSLDTISEKYVDESDYESHEANVTETIFNKRLNKTAEKVFLSKQVNNIMQNNKPLNTSSLNAVSEEYKEENNHERSKTNVTQTTVNEQLNKTAGKVFLSKQAENVTQNNKSLYASSLDTISEEYIDESDYESSEANTTQTTINKKLNETVNKLFLSKQITNISQNKDSLKVNVPDNVSDEYIAEIISDEEKKSTIHDTFTEKPFSPSEQFEGRSFDTKNLEVTDQSDSKIFRLNDKQKSNEKTGDFSKPKEISNNAKLFSIPIQDINEETVKSRPQETADILNNIYKVKPNIELEHETNFFTNNDIDAAVIDVTEKYESGNIEIKRNYTNTETNRNSISNIMNDLENLIEGIKSNSTSSESKADITDSQLLNLELNIVEEYSDMSDTISVGYDETTLESNLYDSLAESPIEITFDNLKTLSAEGKWEELIRPVSLVFEQNIADQITDKAIFMNNDSVTETTEKPAISNDSEVTITSKIQLANLDMSIVEEYSDKPNLLTTGLDGITQASYSNDESLTESPINIISRGEGPLNTKNDYLEPAFDENSHKIIDKPVIDEEIISITKDSTTEASLKIEDKNSYIISSIGISNIEQNSSESNENSTLIITLPNLDEILNENLSVGDDSKVNIGETELLNTDKNISDGVIDKPYAITVVVGETLGSDWAPPSTELSHNVYTNKTTDTPVTDQLNSTEEITTKVEDSVRKVSLTVEDNNITSQTEKSSYEQNANERTNSPSLVDFTYNVNALNSAHATEVAITATQLLNLHLNIAEVSSDKPDTITNVLDETTQNTYLNGKYVDYTPINIIFNILEPLSSNNEQLNIPINTIYNESVTNQPSPNDKDFSITEESIYLTDQNISVELMNELVNSSNFSNDNSSNEPIIFKLINPKNKGYLNESNIAGVKMSSDSIMDNSINFNDAISNKSSIVINGSSNTLKEMFEVITVQAEMNDSSSNIGTQEEISDKTTADQSKNKTNTNSNESHFSNDSSNSVITTEEIYDEIQRNKTENIADEISNESNILNDSSSDIGTQEEISDKTTADQSTNVTNEISNETHIPNDSFSSVIITDKIFDEMIRETLENLTDEISNESHVLYDSTVVTTEEIFNKTDYKSEYLKDEISNESHFSNDSSNSIITNEEIYDEIPRDKLEKNIDEISNESNNLNDSSSNIGTQEEISDETTADQSTNMTNEISNETHIPNDSSSSVIITDKIFDEMIRETLENLTDEISNESHVLCDSTAVTTQEIFDETDYKSEYLKDEISNESHFSNDSSNSIITNEEIYDEIPRDKLEKNIDEISNESHNLNDSSSNIGTQEEISDETTADQSTNMTNEISNETHIPNDSSSSVIITDKIFDEMIRETLENLTDESSNESHVLYDSTVVTTEEIFDETDYRSEYLKDEISNESPLEVIHAFDERSKESTEQTKNVTGENATNEPVIDIRHPSTELSSNEMLVNRKKRSNNIIEEENLATTLSGFKYTGHETRLGHDLRFKNINA